MTPERAEEVAQDALVWILQTDDLAGIFLGWSGANPSDLRARASDSDFLASVLEFLTMDDAWVIGYCQDRNMDPGVPMAARRRLDGPGQDGWN